MVTANLLALLIPIYIIKIPERIVLKMIYGMTYWTVFMSHSNLQNLNNSHVIHHRKLKCNYGLFLMDRIMGTKEKNVDKIYMLSVNNLITLSSVIVLLMILTCKEKFKSEELFYLLLIIDLLILMSSLKEQFDEKFYPNYYEIIPNRHPQKHIKKKNVF